MLLMAGHEIRCQKDLSTLGENIDPSYILTRVQPLIATATGRTYTLSKKEVQDATAVYV